MEAVLESMLSTINGLPAWETLAVVLAIAYLLLAVGEHISCWYCAFISTAIYVFLINDSGGLMLFVGRV